MSAIPAGYVTSSGPLMSGVIRTADCLPGYSATSIYSPMVKCNLGTLSATGCAPSGCSISAAPAGYVAGSCDPKMLSGNKCTATCLPGYSTTDVPTTLTCNLGTLVGTGCTPSRCSITTAPGGYDLSICADYFGGDMASGDLCVAVHCLPGYIQAFPGIGPELRCTLGTLSATGCMPSGCSWARTPAPAGYNVSGCAPLESGDLCTTACLPGYTTTTHSPMLTCTLGTLSAYGCTPSGCNNAPAPTGYDAGGCDPNMVSGGKCTATCLPGYTATAVPTLTCSIGSLSGTGCTPSRCSITTALGYDLSICADYFGGDMASGDLCVAIRCLPGYIQTYPGFNPTLTCTLGKLSATGCMPSVCFWGQQNWAAGYDMSGCPPLAWGDTCNTTCLPGYTTASYNPMLTCNLGILSATGCIPSPCNNPSIPDGYIVSGCGTIASGGSCNASACAYGVRPHDWCADVIPLKFLVGR